MAPTLSTLLLLLNLSWIAPTFLAYKPGDVVPMSKMVENGLARRNRSSMLDFAVDREVLIPIPKPTGYTGADRYK